MEQFVSDKSEQLWNLFVKTGDIRAYMLYSAVQHTPEFVLDKWENYSNQKDEEMSL